MSTVVSVHSGTMFETSSPPTPAAGRTITSTWASYGCSSRLWASMGPLTEAVTVYPACEYVAEPSARGRTDRAASGPAVAVILAELTKTF